MLREPSLAFEHNTSARGSHKLWQPLHNLALYSGWISFFFLFGHTILLWEGEKKKKKKNNNWRTTKHRANVPPNKIMKKTNNLCVISEQIHKCQCQPVQLDFFFFFFMGAFSPPPPPPPWKQVLPRPSAQRFALCSYEPAAQPLVLLARRRERKKKKKKKREKSKCWWRVDQIWLRAETVWTFEVIRSALRCVCVCVFSNINPLKCCFPSVDPNELQPLLSNYVTTWKGEEAPHTVRRKSYRYIFNDLTAIIWTFLTFFWKDDHTACAKNPNLKSSDGYRINTVELRVKRFPSELQWSASGG